MAPKEQAPEPVRLESLATSQLIELRQSLNAEIQRLSEGGATLMRAVTTFSNSKKSVEQLGASKQGQPIMLPLTSSMYVPGEVDDVEKVLLDIGTGYFVEMSIADAGKYYDRRIKSLQDNLQTIQNTLRDRQNTLMSVQAVIQEKNAMAASAAGAAPGRP